MVWLRFVAPLLVAQMVAPLTSGTGSFVLAQTSVEGKAQGFTLGCLGHTSRWDLDTGWSFAFGFCFAFSFAFLVLVRRLRGCFCGPLVWVVLLRLRGGSLHWHWHQVWHKLLGCPQRTKLSVQGSVLGPWFRLQGPHQLVGGTDEHLLVTFNDLLKCHGCKTLWLRSLMGQKQMLHP